MEPASFNIRRMRSKLSTAICNGKSEVTSGTSGAEFARQPASKMKELTLQMDVDTPSAVLLMEHAVEASAWTSQVHADAMGFH